MANGEVFEPVDVPSQAFVWGREGKRMGLNDRRKGDGTKFKPTRGERFPDLHDEPEFMDLSGGVDASERLGDLSDSSKVAEHIGLRFDAVGVVGVVGVGKRGAFKRVGAVDHADDSNTVEVDATTFNAQFALACKIMGVDAKGKVARRGGARKGSDGSSASM